MIEIPYKRDRLAETSGLKISKTLSENEVVTRPTPGGIKFKQSFDEFIPPRLPSKSLTFQEIFSIFDSRPLPLLPHVNLAPIFLDRIR